VESSNFARVYNTSPLVLPVGCRQCIQKQYHGLEHMWLPQLLNKRDKLTSPTHGQHACAAIYVYLHACNCVYVAYCKQ
jgi:hypothetical protein